MFRPKNKIIFVSPLPDWPIESGPHNFFSVIKNVFFYQNLSIYILQLVEVFCSILSF